MQHTAHQIPTGFELLEAQAHEARDAFGELLQYTQLCYHDINAGATTFRVVGWDPYRWAEPKDGAQRRFGVARKRWVSLRELAGQAIRSCAPERMSRLEEIDSLLQNILQQDGGWHGPPSAQH